MIDRFKHAPAGIFQSTLPREERLSLSRLIPTHSNFNPRFHERSDRTVDDGGCSIFISIHASTRGATDKGAVIKGQITISIHASTRGATVITSASFTMEIISIHASTRGATIIELRRSSDNLISIHASTRGATNSVILPRLPNYISIHASTRGATVQLPFLER